MAQEEASVECIKENSCTEGKTEEKERREGQPGWKLSIRRTLEITFGISVKGKWV